MALRKTIARNTAFNAVGRVWEFAAGIILTGYVVRTLGAETYGPWTLVAPFLGYIALLDFGIAAGFSKYIAEHAARDDKESLSAVVSAGFCYYVALGLIIVALGWPVAGFVVSTLESRSIVSEALATDLLYLFRGGLILLAAANCIAPFTAIQTGLQRMGVTNALSFVASIVKIFAVIILLNMHYGVGALLIGEMISTAVFGLCSIVGAFIICPGLRVSPGRASWSAFSHLFVFGWRAQIARISDLIMFQTDKLVVWGHGTMTGIGTPFAMVTRYELGVNLANKIRQGPGVLTSALLPAASKLHTENAHDRIAAMYVQGTKFLAAATIPLVAFAMATADLLFLCWVGPGYSDSAWVLRIIALGYVANIVPGAGVSIALGMGRSGMVMGAGLVSMSTNVVLTILLVTLIGFWGIPIATALSMALSWAWFARAMHKETSISAGHILWTALRWPTVAVTPGVFLAWGAVYLSWPAVQSLTLPIQLAALTAIAGTFFALYAILLTMVPFLDRDDAQLLRTALPLHRIPFAGRWLERATHG